MKFRCLFVTDRKQILVPVGWRIHTVNSVCPAKGKPQYQVLLVSDDPKSRLGFRTK